MSTRAQVIVKDAYGDEVWFYRHSDGYPDGVKESLTKFLDYVKSGAIRDNTDQAAGWLVIIGHKEYLDNKYHFDEPQSGNNCYGWKVGAYEPCAPKQHCDIEYLYTIDLQDKKITYKDIYENETHKLI